MLFRSDILPNAHILDQYANPDNPLEGAQEEDMAGLMETAQFLKDETGYQQIQGTKPQTLSFGLTDSPAGLAAWIVEKFHGWSDHDGDLEKLYTKDQLLTAVTIYWVTNTGTSSAWNYYERRHQTLQPAKVNVPTGCAEFVRRFDRRAPGAMRAVAETRYNIARWTDMPRGGHFPALEQPQLWLDDVRVFFRDRR